MLKTLLVAVWVGAVALFATYAAAFWTITHASNGEAHAEPAGTFETLKTRAISVPMVADGAVQGYVVAQFMVTSNSTITKKLGLNPEPFVIDEAFRTLYGDPKLDFRHLDRYDLTNLTKDLVTRVNARLEPGALKDILVQDFNFLSRDDLRR